MAPITKQEYEKQQSHVRRVFDPDTGRHRYIALPHFIARLFLPKVNIFGVFSRLVKGDGEIIEEVVSYQRHKEINKVMYCLKYIYYEILT